jgi:hypothetical protein
VSIHLSILIQSKFISTNPKKEYVSSDFSIPISDKYSASNSALLFVGFKATKKIIDILIAKTTKTGAKIKLTKFLTSKYVNNQLSILTPKSLPNTLNKATIGDVAIANHNIHILAIKTIAKANSGKNNATANNVLIIKTKKFDKIQSS